MAKTNTEKQFVQMAGEFGVVSELFRRDLQATLTYGNSKSADVFVLSRDCSKAVKVEVKTTVVSTGWIVGKQALSPAKHIVWVFAHLPDTPDKVFSPAQVAEIGTSAPRYYVMTSSEVAELYNAKDDKKGNPIKFTIGDVQKFHNAWLKVAQASQALIN